MRTACAARPVQSRPGAPAMMPSKSAGKRCASTIAWRPPAEQPFQYEYVGAVPKRVATIVFAATVISCTARQPKSISFSGWPSAKLAVFPMCPVSVDAAA